MQKHMTMQTTDTVWDSECSLWDGQTGVHSFQSTVFFFRPKIKRIVYDVIGMVKKTPKMFFRYNGEDMSLITIYNKNKKRHGRSRYLLSIMVDVLKDGEIIPAKVVYVRNRNKRKEYLCLMMQ